MKDRRTTQIDAAAQALRDWGQPKSRKAMPWVDLSPQTRQVWRNAARIVLDAAEATR